MKGILRVVSFTVLLATCLGWLGACDDDDAQLKVGKGTITGVVTDQAGQPLSGVNVLVSGVKEDDMTVTTGADGQYTVEGISMKLHAITFSKDGWLTISKSITTSDFSEAKVAVADAVLQDATAKIIGTIVDGNNDDAPLAGVTVSVGVAGTVTSADDGTYTLENLVAGSYTVTFSKTDYVTLTKDLTEADFVDGVATLAVRMGGVELLRGQTADDLAEAGKWYYNEYRGGRNADAYPHWDWACDYMSSLNFWGAWAEQNEGTTLQIRNEEDQQSNPADLDVFDSYVYGSKLITEDNSILSLRIRTHDADDAAPAYYGVQVVDLTADTPAAVKIGDTQTYGSGDYADVTFDLSDYIGREVVIAIGIYRQATGNYPKQLVLRAIRFSNQKVEGTNWLPGTQVIAGWQLTQETVSGTMPHTKSHFTGISPVTGNRDSYVDAYQAWPAVNHVAAEWSFVPLKKDPEVFPSEGYLIKTRNTSEVNTVVPEAYLYAKFSIASGSNQLTLRTRNFSSKYTFFKLTAIQNDGTVTHVAPASNTAQDASTADNGCWKFTHQNGGAANPEGYASFVYDLSAFNGQDVTLVFGVYNGVAESGENKLVFYSIDLN